MRSFLSRLFGTRAGLQGPLPVRDRGRPPSGNGASSLHLVWEVPPGGFAAVRATLEVTEPPRGPDLYFFALQATFTGAAADHGGGHVGLQWNRRHPGSTAVNWGGYQSQGRGGAVLAGSESSLPSRPGDPNTRDYPWEPLRGYQLTIERGSAPGWWRGKVTDLATATTAVIRELDGGGTHLTAPLVWSEVFAPCDGPPVAVQWTDLEVADDAGQWVTISRVRANYQPWEAGGCTNTDSSVHGAAFKQTTNSTRLTRNGDTLDLNVPR